jgi:serine/threonine-protein phosphatase PGAM5
MAFFTAFQHCSLQYAARRALAVAAFGAPVSTVMGTAKGHRQGLARLSSCEQAPRPEKKATVGDPQDPFFDDAIFSTAPRWRRGWNSDWDGRHPDVEENDITSKPPTFEGRVRHVLLVRHGQYDLDDVEHPLTPLGREQATSTGRRLAALSDGIKSDAYGDVKISYSSVVSSNVLRAQQTANIISDALGSSVHRETDDVLLAEGWPVLPYPQGPDFLRKDRIHPATIIQDAPRIEAGFRKYVRRDVDHKRLSPAQKDDLTEAFSPESRSTNPSGPAAISPEAAAAAQLEHEYIILVCHMNVIRYFVARALQLPPEAWLRMRGNNCGITELIIQPSGLVSLGSFADTGHLTLEQLTFH